MISFNYENDFQLEDKSRYSEWVSAVILSENKSEGDINFIFCDDDYLHNLNVEYLKHDTLTDVISFDYSVGNEIHGDVFISTERVAENALELSFPFLEELRRVMIHGVLHYCGYKDKSESDELLMRSKEDEKLALFHVELN